MNIIDYNKFLQYWAPPKFPNLPTPTVINCHPALINFHRTLTAVFIAFTSSVEPLFSPHRFKPVVQHPIGAHQQHHHPFLGMPLPSYFISLLLLLPFSQEKLFLCHPLEKIATCSFEEKCLIFSGFLLFSF